MGWDGSLSIQNSNACARYENKIQMCACTITFYMVWSIPCMQTMIAEISEVFQYFYLSLLYKVSL